MGVDYSTTAGFGFVVSDDEIFAASVRLGAAPTLEIAQEEFPSDELETVLQEVNKRMKERFPDDESGLRAQFFSAGTMYTNAVKTVYIIVAKSLTIDEYTNKYHTSMSPEEMDNTAGFLYEVQELLGVEKPLEFHLGLYVY